MKYSLFVQSLHDAWSFIPPIPSITYIFATLFIVGFILIPLERYFPAQSNKKLKFQSECLNLMYWFFTPLFTRFLNNIVLVAALIGIFYLQGRPLNDSLLDGFGPLSRQSLLLQSIEILFAADFIEYCTHRFFHKKNFWKFHAIHHSAENMNWLASARMHPVNDLVTRTCQILPLLALGFSIRGVLIIIPYLFFYVIFLHSNLRWDFGPFRYILVSPAYHQWHHTSDTEGLDKNFAGIFPIWDIIFGTCYFPNRSPKNFGVTKEPPPETIVGQLLYPFRATSPVEHK